MHPAICDLCSALLIISRERRVRSPLRKRARKVSSNLRRTRHFTALTLLTFDALAFHSLTLLCKKAHTKTHTCTINAKAHMAYRLMLVFYLDARVQCLSVQSFREDEFREVILSRSYSLYRKDSGPNKHGHSWKHSPNVLPLGSFSADKSQSQEERVCFETTALVSMCNNSTLALLRIANFEKSFWVDLIH